MQHYLSGELSFQNQRRERLRQLFATKLSLSDADADAMFNTYLEFYEASWRLFPDVTDCLNALDGFPLGIISNGNTVQQKQKLAARGILNRFSIVAVSSDVGVPKPDAGIFAAACRKPGSGPPRVGISAMI